MAVTLITGNLKGCLMKKLIILKHLIIVFIVSSPLRLGWGGGGVLVFKIWTKREVMKKWLRNRGLVERGSFQIISSVFLQKSMFSLLLAHFFFVW